MPTTSSTKKSTSSTKTKAAPATKAAKAKRASAKPSKPAKAASAKSAKAASAKPAKAANAKPAKSTSTKPAKATSAKSAKAAGAKSTEQITADLEAFLRRLRKPRIAKVAAEIIAYAKSAGGAFAQAAQDLGVLQKAAKIGEHGLVSALLDAGVDPNTDAEEHPGSDRALAAVFDDSDLSEKSVLAIVKTLLAKGATPDALCPDGVGVQNLNFRRETALDAAVKRRSMAAIELLANASSPTTRTHGLNTLLDERAFRFDDEAKAALARMLDLADLDVPDHDGMYALHMAAKRGDLAIVEGIFARAKTKLPRLAEDVSAPLELAVRPAGGMYPTVKFPAGSSPLAVARLVRARLAQTVAEFHRQGDEGQRTYHLPQIEPVVAGCAAIVEFLEGQGQVDDTKAAPLAAPLATVLAACSELAANLGIATFDERAALIDSTRTGAFGFFLECAKLIRPELDDAGRAKLEQHLVGKFITGTIERNVLLRDEEDDLEDFGPDPKQFRVWPEDYPEEFQSLLESAAHYGVNGDAVLSLEARDGDTTKLWEISHDAGVDHGPVDLWVKSSVTALIRA